MALQEFTGLHIHHDFSLNKQHINCYKDLMLKRLNHTANVVAGMHDKAQAQAFHIQAVSGRISCLRRLKTGFAATAGGGGGA